MDRGLTWACRIVGPIVFLLWATVFIWASTVSVPVEDNLDQVLPASGAMTLTSQRKADTTCEVWTDAGDLRTFVVRYEAGNVFGPRLPRWWSGAARIRCKPAGAVWLNTGGPVALYPVGRSWAIPVVGFALTVAGFRRRLFKLPLRGVIG